MPDFIFDSWPRLGEVALVAVLIYIALLAMLRISGKRTLAKFNAFDFVVTVAIGSMVANTVLNEETTLLSGVIGIAVLVSAQAAVSFGASHWQGVQNLVKSQPVLLYYRGSFQRTAMIRERVATEEIRQAVRSAGFARLAQVGAVVLETDGTISVMGDDVQESPLDALANVRTEDADLDRGDPLPPVAQWSDYDPPPAR
jgi:uncharacterized membrane protein YcaP (DUF421 family)